MLETPLMKHRFPPLELLEANHRFPGAYTFKVIGINENEFLKRILDEVKSVLKPDQAVRHSVREASGGKHSAITLEVTVETAHQIIHIYEKLVIIDGVVVVL